MEKNDLVPVTGRARGGLARAAAMSPENRAASARRAAEARWANNNDTNLPTVICGSAERPLRIGEIEIPCYVLSDKRRVLVQRGLQQSIGMSTSGGSDGAQRLALFIEGLAKKGVDCNELAVRIRTPILFRPSVGGRVAYGYEATIINDICDAVLSARRTKGALAPQQKRFAVQCEALLSYLARRSIIFLVDEATGYDRLRTRESIQQIVERYVAKILKPYLPTFPDEYYEHIYRLNNWPYNPDSTKRPGVVGHWTNDIVYARLAPAVLDELRRLTPRDENGRLKNKLFQFLTDDVGSPKLSEHFKELRTLMKAARNWKEFYSMLDRALPRFGETMELPFDDTQAMEALAFKSPNLLTSG
jgi:P63C domain